MHNKEKYPSIWAEKEKAEEELVPLLNERAKHTDKIADIQCEINALDIQKNETNDLAMKDAKRIKELRDTIARMAKAMGAKAAG